MRPHSPHPPTRNAAARPEQAHSHQNHRRRRCGGRRRDRRARAGFEARCRKQHKQEGRRGACGAWPRCRWAAAGPGRASRSTTPSHQARVWLFERAGRRPPAHTAARPIQTGHAAAGDLAGRATPEIWRDHSHNRQRPGRLLHNSPHGSSPRRPRRISYDVRPVASHARSYRLG